MTQRTILLDMDGVLVDFFTAALRVHGMEHLADNWPAGEWDMAKVMGISEGVFWRKIDDSAANGSFWFRMEKYKWADELIELCEQSGRVILASTPSQDPECAKQKIQWMYSNRGTGFRWYMLGPHKDLLARPGSVLIDDNDGNVSKFKAAGGEAILFPQPWNNNHEYSKCDRVAFVRNALQGM